MTTRWAKRPLDPDAVQTANEKLWSQFEELGGRKLKMGPKDRSYRKYWMDSYLEALSERQSIPTDPSDLESVPPEDSDLMCIPVGEQVLECVSKLGTLIVFVSATDGFPLEGADVVILGPEVRSGVTDENGIVVFSDLTPGDYESTGLKEGYKDDEAAATVTAETSQMCELKLEPFPEYPKTVTCDVSPENPDGFYTVFSPGVEIRGSSEFQERTVDALETLSLTRTGQRIFSDVDASGNKVKIIETGDNNGYCTARDGAASQTPALGTDSTVEWNPDHHTTDAADPVTGSPGSTVILGHELIHASHNATGTNGNGPYDSYPGQAGASARGEERATVGAGGTRIVTPPSPPVGGRPGVGIVEDVPDHSNDIPTENSLRDDLGIPRRPTYYPSTWPGGPPW